MHDAVRAAAEATADIIKLTEQIESARERRDAAYRRAMADGLLPVQIAREVKAILVGQRWDLRKYRQLGISRDAVTRANSPAKTLDTLPV